MELDVILNSKNYLWLIMLWILKKSSFHFEFQKLFMVDHVMNPKKIIFSFYCKTYSRQILWLQKPNTLVDSPIISLYRYIILLAKSKSLLKNHLPFYCNLPLKVKVYFHFSLKQGFLALTRFSIQTLVSISTDHRILIDWDLQTSIVNKNFILQPK